MSNVHYVPVVNTHTITALRRKLKWHGKDLAFFTKNSIIKSQHYLLNPYHCKDQWEKDYKDFEVNSDSVIFADSGGLQEITLGSDNAQSPSFIKEIFQWQQAHCNVGFSFDVIPFEMGTWKFLADKFEECARSLERM